MSREVSLNTPDEDADLQGLSTPRACRHSSSIAIAPGPAGPADDLGDWKRFLPQ
jgi:hypothetical protein